MSHFIREIRPDEYPVLEEFLYQAIFVPKGADAPPRTILRHPQVAMYIDRFGERPDDTCLIALVDHQIVGAVWTRIMRDYGHVDDETPSLSMSVLTQYRGRGIGTSLLRTMLAHLKDKGYQQVSLSVQKENDACKLYQNAGFTVHTEHPDYYVMVRQL